MKRTPRALAPVAAAVLAILGAGLAWGDTAAPAIPEAPPGAYTLATPFPTGVERIIAQAVAVVSLPCHPTFEVAPLDALAGQAWPDGCRIALDPSTVDDPDGFYAAYVIRHEVAHLVTADRLGAQDPHGPLFRAVLAEMLRPLRIVEVYDDAVDPSYPVRTYWRGRCVLGSCDEVAR